MFEPEMEREYQKWRGAAGQHKEIEFVCVNPAFDNATPLKTQEKMFSMLGEIEGIIGYIQNWGDGQKSLAVILIDPQAEREVLSKASEVGIAVDKDAGSYGRSEEFVRSVESGLVENYEKHITTPMRSGTFKTVVVMKNGYKA